MIVSCDASDTFHRKSFQNDRFVRGFFQISQNKLPKWSFRARLPPNFKEKASKMIVSREASSKFHRTSFQNDRLVRGFLQISQNHASKTSVSRDASDNFHQKFAFRYSFARWTHRFLREGSSAKSKMCLALQRRALPNVTMRVSPQRRAQKCMNLSTVNRPASRTQKCEVLLQFWAIDTTFLLRGLPDGKWNLRFATFLGDRHHVFSERVDREQMKFAFRYSFGRSTPRFYREGWPLENEICVSLQFWAIDTTFLPRGLPDGKWNLRFATVLADRHHVFTERVHREQMKFAFRYSFGRSTTRF